MSTIRLDWTWEVESALHCGSGLSRPGVADDLIQRDAKGQPWIPGEAVRGVLRMSAEQVAGWLGRSQQMEYDQTAPWEPKAEPLARIFGRGRSHVSPGTLTGDSRPRTPVLASTAIDSMSGTARDNTLREIEVAVAAENLRFSASCSVSVADDLTEGLVDAVETLLVASLAASETIGGRAGIGWGRLKLLAADLFRDSQPRDRLAAVSEHRLAKLRSALATQVVPASMASHASAAPVPDASFAWFQLDIHLCEPACFPVQPEISNTVVTEQGLRATALRGALQRFWREQGIPEEEVLSFLSDRTRWSPGLPIEGDTVFVPAPLSFAAPKGTTGFGSGGFLIDALRDERPPKDERGRRPSVRPIAARWIGVRDGALAPLASAQETRMHVARDYWSGSKRSGALYARESLSPASAFRAWARLPIAAFRDRLSFTLHLGKRTGAGNGLAIVTVTPLGDDHQPFVPSVTGTTDCDVFVHLLSPAIVRGKDGHPLRGLAPDEWVRLAGVADVRILSVQADSPEGDRSGHRSAATRRGGWMVNWGHQRGAVTAIQPGSAWRLRCASAADADRLRSALAARRQIGDRPHEGFGWIAVDPVWIRRHSAPPATMTRIPAGPPPTTEDPRSWAGMEGVARHDLLTVLEDAREALGHLREAAREDLQAPLHELAHRARIDDCVPLVAFWRARTAKRHNGSVHLRWRALAADQPVGRLLSQYWSTDGGRVPNPGLLRFALEALMALTRREREASS